MRNKVGLALLPVVLGLALTLVPAPARAAAGDPNSESCSNIVCRIWVMFFNTTTERTQTEVPVVTRFMQGAEELFLGGTMDMSQEAAIQDVYAAMRTVGVLILAFCFVFSLAEVSMAPMLGQNFTLANWFWRLCVATVMTFGSLSVYGVLIRFGNYCVHILRDYLATHWTGTFDPSGVYNYLLAPGAVPIDGILILLFIVIYILVNIALWFLLGGIRTAEIGLHILIAPFAWPLYLIPSLDDIPKTAFRGFLMFNFLLLFVVAMVRTAARLVTSGSLGQTVWAFIPAIAFLGMSVFMPAVLKRIFGQGHTGVSALSTAVSVLAGLKGLKMLSQIGQGAAGAAPASAAPATSMAPNPNPLVPAAPSVAPVPYPGGGAQSYAGQLAAEPLRSPSWPSPQIAAGARSQPLLLDAPLQHWEPGAVIDCRPVYQDDGSILMQPGPIIFDEKLARTDWMPGKGGYLR